MEAAAQFAMKRRHVRTLGAVLIGLLAGAAGVGQTTGSIQGVVRDPSGGVLLDADVLVSSPSLQGARAIKAGRMVAFGWRRFPLVPTP
jgi:hypothetical protein